MKCIILFFATILSISSYAQEKKTDKDESTPPMIYRGVGMSFQSFDELNSRIAGHPEYKALRDYAGTLDLGFLRSYKRFISGLDLTIGSSMSGDRDKKSSTIRYAGAGIDLGYDLIPSEKIMLFPTVGIGGQEYMARFYKDVSAVPFDVVLTSSDVQNAIKPVNFRNHFTVYRLGIGFGINPYKKGQGYLGIRASYMGSFKDKSWKSSDNQVLANAPSDKLSQFNISLIIMNAPRMHMGK